MNQEKIGKFIAECRKNQKLTQEQLAEKLNITYKAVSKWECGKGLPDASIMMDLCNILEINVNDLLSGEKVDKDSYIDRADENLIRIQKQKEATNVSARFCYILTIIILLVCNGLNIFMYGVEEALEKPEFIIMSSVTLIWLLIYSYLINKVSNE